jgi:hypothetical protein
MRARWLATRCGSPRRSAKGTASRGGNVAPINRDNRLPCEDNLQKQICAR